jgi:hypothetical protein
MSAPEAKAAIDDGPHGVVLAELLGQARDVAPHGQVDGVAQARAIEGQGRDRAVLLDEDVVAHEG